MSGSKRHYGTEEIEEKPDLKELIYKAIKNEHRDIVKYSILMHEINDDEIKETIDEISKEEETHLEMLEKMYFRLTNELVKLSTRKPHKDRNLRELLKDCFDSEMDMVRLYRDIYIQLQEEESKETINSILMEEQLHASKFMKISIRKMPQKDLIVLMREPVTITPKEIRKKNEFIEEDLRVPVIRGISNLNVQNKINNEIESDITEFKNQMEQAAEEDGKQAKAQGKKFRPYVIATNYTETYDKNNILSISIIYNQFINGRQTYIMTSYNYDTVNGRPMSLKDLFYPGVQYRELINQAIRRELQTNKAIYPPDAATKFKGITEDQPFYLQDKNIVIYFGFNEIAPTVAQIPIIKIPFSTFKNQMKPAFLS